MLTWHSRHGWAIVIEYGTEAELLVLGYLGVYVQQMGPEQERFFEAWSNDVLPHLT